MGFIVNALLLEQDSEGGRKRGEKVFFFSLSLSARSLSHVLLLREDCG
jgi:hypothetical protein